MNKVKPREVIYLLPYKIPSDSETFFNYLAMDEASQVLFALIPTTDCSAETYLEKIDELMNNKDFQRYDCPFELVLSEKIGAEQEIETLIKPFKGRLTFDKERVLKHTQSVIKFLNKQYANRNKQ